LGKAPLIAGAGDSLRVLIDRFEKHFARTTRTVEPQPVLRGAPRVDNAPRDAVRAHGTSLVLEHTVDALQG
jgi:hypothetical protein